MSSRAKSSSSRSNDAMLVVRATMVAVSVPALARVGLLRLERVLEPRRVPVSTDARAVDDVHRAVERALRFSRRFLRPTCMTRGLTRYYLLRRAGVDVALRFGL